MPTGNKINLEGKLRSWVSAKDVVLKLIQQMEEEGTELCLNACPSCQTNIDQFLREQHSPILAIDISQLVQRLSQNYLNSLINTQ